MGLFGRKKANAEAADTGQTPDAGDSAAPPIQTDPRKAQRFFEYARSVTDEQSYDYAIETYLKGLRLDPAPADHHMGLYEIARLRKINGGKPAGFREQFGQAGRKTPLDRMLNAELRWAKDPMNPELALHVMEHAAEAGLKDVAILFGQHAIEVNQGESRPSRTIYKKAQDLFARIGAWEKAIEACQLGIKLDPHNLELQRELKELQAELNLVRGGHGEAGGSLQAGDEEGPTRSIAAAREAAKRLRREYEDNPDNIEKLTELVRALVEQQDEDAEEEAISLLEDAYARLGRYRLKVHIGDVRILQYSRRIRELRQQAAEAQTQEEEQQYMAQARAVAWEQVRFELEEFQERLAKHPDDKVLHYQIGRRQLILGDYDAAIPSLQKAQEDPQHRASALRYLGEAFARKGAYDEAIDTFHRGIEVHSYSDDRLALDLRYELMEALEQKARETADLKSAEEAAELAEEIARINSEFKALPQRRESIQQLVEQLKKGGSDSATAPAGS